MAQPGALHTTSSIRAASKNWPLAGVLLFWAIATVQSVAWRYYASRAFGRPVALDFIVRAELIMFGIAALFTPAVVHLARRYRLEPGRWMRPLLVHFGCGIFFALLVKLLWDFAMLPMYATPWIVQPFSLRACIVSLTQGLQVNVLLYWLVVIGASALEAAELRVRLAEAQLDGFRKQMDPHFLFNALNSISALVHKDPEAAESMIADLSDLLRRSLSSGEQPRILLSEEIQLVTLYLGIVRRRFEERLRVELEVRPELPVDRISVPGMLLQPLVENAVRHAISNRTSGGTVIVRASAADSRLLLEVEDRGGLPTTPPVVEGVGLRSIRQRLRILYPGRHEFNLVPGAEGLVARVCLPLNG